MASSQQFQFLNPSTFFFPPSDTLPEAATAAAGPGPGPVSLRALSAITLAVLLFRTWNFVLRPFLYTKEFPVLPYWIPCMYPYALPGLNGKS